VRGVLRWLRRGVGAMRGGGSEWRKEEGGEEVDKERKKRGGGSREAGRSGRKGNGE